MSLLLIAILIFLGLYLTTSVLYIAYYYFKSRKSDKGLIKFRTDQFFMVKGEAGFGRLTVKGKAEPKASSKVKADVSIIIDYSGSMHGKPLEQVKWGALTFVRNAVIGEQNIKVGVSAFNHEAMIVSDLQGARSAVKKAIKRVPEASGGTSIYQGLRSGLAVLEASERKEDNDVQKIIILLTDGYDDQQQEILQFASYIKEQGVRIFCIGIDGADESLLRNIAKDPQSQEEQTFYTTNPEEIVRFFEQIHELITGNTGKNAKIEFNFNHKNMVYLATKSEHLTTNIEPLTWVVPWLRPQEEQILFRFLPTPCIGLYPINTSPTKMQYELIEDDAEELDNTIKTETNEKSAYVIVMPFNPAWLAALLIHPLLWGVLYKKFCPHKTIEYKEPDLPINTDLELGEVPMLEQQPVQQWHPTLCIALGGGGIASALRFKALATDAANTDKVENNFYFLNIDTESYSSQQPYFGGVELDNFISIGADLWQEHLETMNDPARHPWYPYRLNESLDREIFDTRNGCSNNRLLGRLSLHCFLAEHPEVIKDHFENAVKWLAEKKEESPHVMVFTSPIGGTGSAIFFDLTHLLLAELEKQQMETQIVQAIFPMPDTDDYREHVKHHYQANEAAFLLELERVKSTIRFLPDLADYPFVKPLNIRRFTHAEYVVWKTDADTGSAFSSAACLAVSLANADSDFSEKVEQDIIYHLRQQEYLNSGSVITTAVNADYAPINLCREYLEIKFVQQLLADTQGIKLSDDGVYDAQIDIADETVNALIELFLLGREIDYLEPLKSEIPLLFQYLQSMAQSNISHKQNENVFLGALKRLSEIKEDRIRQHNLELMVIRLIEWCFSILTQYKESRLACALLALDKLEDTFFNAAQLIQNTSINPNLDVELLLLYSEERLTAVNQLIYDYIRIVQVISQHLRNWAYSLSEGYPKNWNGVKAQKSFIGLARKNARKIEIIRECFADYPRVKVPQLEKRIEQLYSTRLEQIGHEKVNNIQDRVNWAPTQLLKNKRYSSVYLEVIEKQENPFCLQITESEKLNQYINHPVNDQQKLEACLIQLSGYCSPWLKRNDIPVSEVQEPQSESDQLRLKQELSEDCFAISSAKIELALNAHPSFRDSVFYKNRNKSAALMRGHRNHVLKADMRAAMIQRIYAENRQLQAPCYPQITYLMENLHRLQRYLYLCLEDQVQLMNHPQTLQQVWAVILDGKKYYLSQTAEEAEFDAAIQFVLREKCLLDGKDIIVGQDWQPNDQDKTRLDSHLNTGSDPFLNRFDMILTVMQQSNGYFQPLSEMTTKYIADKM